MSALLGRLRHVLDAAVLAYAGTAQGSELAALRSRLDEPLRVAIAGRVKAGKSTLLNALVGDRVAPTDAGECTRIVTWYREAASPGAVVYPRAGMPEPVAFRHRDGALDVDLGGRGVEDVDRIVVGWPSAALRPFTLIDTPGLDSVNEDVAARTERALLPSGERAGIADAVVYLLRHVHGTDVRFLEAFAGGAGAAPAPVHCLGVLARADEVGAARLDAMASAARVARRYGADPRLQSRCASYVAVSALLAQAGATLTEAEFGALAALAHAESPAVDDLLLDASNFAEEHVGPDPGGVGADARRDLLDRLGLAGLRLSLEWLRRREVSSAGELGRRLVEHSGLDELRTLLATRLASRRDLLKGRSALAALNDLVQDRAGHPGTAALAAEVEALTAGAHELAEAALLGSLRHLELGFSDDEIDAAERVLGGAGDTRHARLGLDDESPAAVVVSAAAAELGRWQRRAESPFSSPKAIRAARVLVRSCEGLAREATVSSQA